MQQATFSAYRNSEVPRLGHMQQATFSAYRNSEVPRPAHMQEATFSAFRNSEFHNQAIFTLILLTKTIVVVCSSAHGFHSRIRVQTGHVN